MIDRLFQRVLKHHDGIYPRLCLTWVRVKHSYKLDRGLEGDMGCVLVVIVVCLFCLFVLMLLLLPAIYDSVFH